MSANSNRQRPPTPPSGNEDLIQSSIDSERNLKTAWETLKQTWLDLKSTIRQLFQEERDNVNGQNQEEVDRLKKRITDLIGVGDELTSQMETMNQEMIDYPARSLAEPPPPDGGGQKGGYRYKTPKNRRKTKSKSKTMSKSKSKSPSKSKKIKKSRRKSKY